MQFLAELLKIMKAIEIINGWVGCTAAAKAKSFLTAVTSSHLMITILHS